MEERAARKRLLLGRLDNCGVTAETKKRGWATVAESVSAVGGMARDSDAVKKQVVRHDGGRVTARPVS